MDIYLYCLRATTNLKIRIPKFLAFQIVDYCDDDEQFKYGHELAERHNNIDFIFEKACEVNNLYLVSKYYLQVDVKKGFISACMRNNLRVINFLKDFSVKRKYIESSANAGHFETAWMLSKNKKVYRPILLYTVLTLRCNTTKDCSTLKNHNFISKFLQKKISFDYALCQAIRENNRAVLKKIIKLNMPCDAGLKLAFSTRNMDLIFMLSSNIINKTAFAKKLIKKHIYAFNLIPSSPGEGMDPNNGMVLAAKYGNKRAYDYFVNIGGRAFNEALAKACKYDFIGFTTNATYCDHCENKIEHI